MKAGQVLEFPKENSVRVRAQAKVRNQKAILALSILSVVMLSVLTNQYITRPHDAKGQSRGIASVAAPMNLSDVRWEHELARELAVTKDSREAHLAEKPSLKDELIFGALEGRYGARVLNGRIAQLEFANVAGEEALKVDDRAAFLTKYREAFLLNFERVGLASTSSEHEVWNLLNSERTIVGQARFSFDGQGRVLSMTLL